MRRSPTAVVLSALAPVLALVAWAYAPVLHHRFLDYDDLTYVTDNPAVRAGLTWSSIRWGLGAMHAANWHPLTWWSHMLDVSLFGMDAGRHLAVSVGLHMACAVVLGVVLARLTGDAAPSAAVAALFALHPLQVESVAWVAERKSTLSTLCWFLAMGCYGAAVARPTAGRRLGVLAATVAALAAKPMAVTLPATLVLLDAWPLGRWRPGHRLRCIAEKLPLFAMAGAVAALTWAAQHAGGAVASLDDVPLGMRLADAIVAYAIYPWKLLVPSGLCIMHPMPDSAPLGPAAVAAGALLAVSVLAWRARARRPYVLVGWLWYLGTLFPVSGVMAQGEQLWADRFAYVPAVGLLVMLVWGARDLVRAGRLAPAPAVAALGAILLVLAGLTRRQVATWQDSITVFTRVLAVHPDDHVAHRMLAMALIEASRPAEGLAHAERGLALAPGDPALRSALAVAHVDLGVAAEQAGRLPDAERHYRLAIAAEPEGAVAHNDLGLVLLRSGHLDEAAAELRAAVAARRDYGRAWATLGHVLLATGHAADAQRALARAVALEPALAPAHLELAAATAALGDVDAARARYEALIAWAPAAERDEAARRLAALPAPALR